jgi:hypothetical protein
MKSLLPAQWSRPKHARLPSLRDRVRAGRWRVALVGCSAFLAMAAVFVWPPAEGAAGGPEPFSLLRDAEPRGPVTVETVASPLVWRASYLPSSTATVSNGTSRSITCEIWWLLAATGDREPWSTYAARSVSGLVDLPPDSASEVELPPAGTTVPAPGLYSLSFWVHCQDDSDAQWRHSDGATMRGAVRIVAGPAGLDSRGGSPMLWIQQIAGRVGTDAGTSTITVTLGNAAPEPRTVQLAVRCASTARVGSASPSDGQQVETISAMIPAASLTDFPVPCPWAGPDATPALTVELRLHTADSMPLVDVASVSEGRG